MQHLRLYISIFWVSVAFFGLPQELYAQPKQTAADLNNLAEAYVKLGLMLGTFDKNYVDAYYGPEDWRPKKTDKTISLMNIEKAAKNLLQRLSKMPVAGQDSQLGRRHQYLEKQLSAMLARIEMLNGKQISFDQEAKRVYDAAPPKYSEAHFQALLAELEDLIPGKGTLHDRLQSFRNAFVIPPEKLDRVFKTAIGEARKRSSAHLDLPEGETFEVAYVTNKPWSGYNWYQGRFKSLIQVNTDLPITIDRAIDLACHEGYPGHHVYNVLLEKHLVRDLGWQEYSFYPLFSPQSLIAEGTANYGIRMAFPAKTRVAYEQQVLFPLAGLDPQQTSRYYQVMALLQKLKYAGNEAARGYLNKDMSGETAVSWLKNYALMSEPKARQRLSFFDTYRAYVINYNLGEDLVATYMDHPSNMSRWQRFKSLLAAPWVPSLLTKH